MNNVRLKDGTLIMRLSNYETDMIINKFQGERVKKTYKGDNFSIICYKLKQDVSFVANNCTFFIWEGSTIELYKEY